MARQGRRFSDRDQATWITFILAFSLIGIVIYLFTPYTNNLDEIKVSLVYMFGSPLLALYLYYRLRGSLQPVEKKVLVPLLAYIVLLVISTLLAQHKWIGWIIIGYHVAMLGPFFCLAGTMRSYEWVRRAIFVYTVLVFGTTVFGIVHYAGLFVFLQNHVFLGLNPWRDFDSLIYTLARAREMFSTILNRDFYASFLAMLIPVAASGTIIFETQRQRIFAGVTCVLMVVCLYLAFSKDSAAAFIMSALFFFIVVGRYTRLRVNIPHLRVWIVGSLIILGTLFFFTHDIILARSKGFDIAISSRKIIWGGGWQIFLHNPILGAGPGSFRVLFPIYRNPDYHLHDISNVTLFAHNRYLDLLAENGVLGFIAYMGFVGMIFFFGMRQIAHEKDERLRVCQIGLLTAVFGVLFTNIFSPNNRWVVVGINYWALMGLSLGTYGLSFRASAAPTGQRQPGVARNYRRILLQVALWVTIAASLASMIYGVRYFLGAAENNTGLKYMEYRQYQVAIEHFKRSLRWNPTFLTAYYKLAHAYNQTRQIDNAFKTYQDLARYAPDYSEIHYNLGVVHSSLADQDTRKLRAGNLTPQEKEKLQQEIEQHRSLALKEFETASAMSNKPNVKYTMAMMYKEYNMLEKAFELYKNMRQYTIKFEDEFLTFEDLARIYRESEVQAAQLALILGKFDYAEKAYRELYSKYPGNDEYLRALTTIYSKLNEREKLYKLLREAVSYNPLDPTARIQLTRAYLEDHKYQDALTEARIAQKVAPEQKDILRLLAEIYYRLGDQKNFEQYKQYLPKTLVSDRLTS
jgi:putative inorganic carbon (HCO3(-)) transporter